MFSEDLAILGVFHLTRTPTLQAKADPQGLQQRAVVVETDRIPECGKPEAMPQEERVEQEIVEAARIAHHVNDTAALFERLQSFDDGLIEFHEAWEWESQPGTGTSLVRELRA